MESSLFAPEIRDQTCRHASFVLAAVISSSLTVIIFNKDFDLILKESHASIIRFLDTSFSNLRRTTPPVTVHKLGFSPFVPNASVNLSDVLIGALSILVAILFCQDPSSLFLLFSGWTCAFLFISIASTMFGQSFEFFADIFIVLITMFFEVGTKQLLIFHQPNRQDGGARTLIYFGFSDNL